MPIKDQFALQASQVMMLTVVAAANSVLEMCLHRVNSKAHSI